MMVNERFACLQSRRDEPIVEFQRQPGHALRVGEIRIKCLRPQLHASESQSL